MSRLFLGNFEFEYELLDNSPRATGSSQNSVRQHRDSLATAWLALASREDEIVLSRAPSAADFPEWVAQGGEVPRFVSSVGPTGLSESRELIPWGWSSAMHRLARSHGLLAVGPAGDVVREVNRRSFRMKLEQDLKIDLPHSGTATSMTELRQRIASLATAERGWILKAEFGMSGREAMRGRGGTLTEPLANWAQRRIAQSGAVVVEPVVERAEEVGIQFDVPVNGEPRLIGLAELLVDRSGTYRGSRCGQSLAAESVWRAAIDVAAEVANRLQSLGYWGPLGIDAMRYRAEDGSLRIRPLQDLNARFTLGRIALEFHRRLGGAALTSWLHLPLASALSAGRKQLEQWLTEPPTGVVLVPTSPRNDLLSTAPFSVLVVTESRDVGERFERELLA